MIGFCREPNQTCRILCDALETLGHDVRRFHPWDSDKHHLHEYYKDEDLCIVFQTNIDLIHDILIDVIYYHPEILSPASLDRWDYLIVGGHELINFMVCFYRKPMAHCKATMLSHYGVKLEEWPLSNQDRCTLPFFMGHMNYDGPHWMWKSIYQSRQFILKSIQPLIRWFGVESYEYYKKTLYSSLYTVIIHGDYCYLNQRIFEAAAAGCIPLIYTGNSDEKYYTELGLIHGVNCWFFKDVASFSQLFLFSDNQKIAIEARKWVEQHHTIYHRAKHILEWYATCKHNYERFQQTCSKNSLDEMKA